MKHVYIVQTVREHHQGSGESRHRTFDKIDTIACSADFLEAKQYAIDYCYYYGRSDFMVWEAPEATEGFQSGENWKQIAPMGFEVSKGDEVTWVRIEKISLDAKPFMSKK